MNVFPRSLMLVLEREWLELPIATEVQDELRLGNQCCESHPRKQLDLNHAASVQSHVETEQSTLLNNIKIKSSRSLGFRSVVQL